jgi:hypothetical protein
MPNNFNQRRRELFCLGYLLVVAIAFRIWILVIESYNTYLEIAASIITFFLFLGIFLRIRRGIRGNHEDEGEIDAENIRDARDIEIARVLLISLSGNRRDMRRNSISDGGLSPQSMATLPRLTYRIGLVESSSAYDEAARSPEITCGDSISTAEQAFLATSNFVVNNPINQDLTDCKCPICLDNFVDDTILIRLPLCWHEYHERCIITWLTSRRTCPLCMRSVINELAPVPDTTLLAVSTTNSITDNFPVPTVGIEVHDLEAQTTPTLYGTVF